MRKPGPCVSSPHIVSYLFFLWSICRGRGMRSVGAGDAEPVELSLLDTEGETKEPTPLVFIEGWAAGTSAKIFSGLDELLNEGKDGLGETAQGRRLLVIKCGCYSSLWDRAHEIYYALKGGRCDYGEAHSLAHNHARYGRTHERGLYENWSAAYPLHFAGHSFGGVTIYYLQQLLGTDVLPGTPAMFKSVTCISSPLRGTPLTSALGQLDGSAGAGQKRFSVGWIMSLGIHFAKTANILSTDLYDFGGDQFTTTSKDEHGLVNAFCEYLAGNTLGSSADSASFDMLMTTMDRHNQNASLCQDTFYRAYTASTSIPLLLPPLAYCHYLVSTASHPHSTESEWRDNDGFVPLASQMHPRECHETTCLHLPTTVAPEDEPPALPGVWHVREYRDTTHFELVDYLWKFHTSKKTKSFWLELGKWLRRVDAQASFSSTLHEPVKDSAVSIVEA